MRVSPVTCGVTPHSCEAVSPHTFLTLPYRRTRGQKSLQARPPHAQSRRNCLSSIAIGDIRGRHGLMFGCPVRSSAKAVAKVVDLVVLTHRESVQKTGGDTVGTGAWWLRVRSASVNSRLRDWKSKAGAVFDGSPCIWSATDDRPAGDGKGNIRTGIAGALRRRAHDSYQVRLPFLKG